VRILVQAAPADVDVAAIRSELAALDGVQDVHDVHVWTLTSGMEVGSAHLTVDAECDPAVVLTQAQTLLAERHHLAHFTLQVEPPGARTGCAELAW
jgi:cobalt-zinc-cadmium efflux system protein